MADRDVALGDREEARETRLGGEEIVAARIQRPFRRPIADREQLAVAVEQKAELHRERRRASVLFEDRKTHLYSGSVVCRLTEITAMGFDRAPDRLCPEPHVRAGVVASFDRKRAGDIGDSLGLDGKPSETFRDVFPIHEHLSHAAGEESMRVVELVPGHRLRSASIPQVVRLIAGKIERISNTGKTPRICERQNAPFPTRIGECDQVPGQVAAIDGGDVPGFERS